ncbi:MAG: rhomboid family intramembrane serine protease [Thermodesulfobacteria bacterium]|nr:rhomboid family intramembrane serine protease [Thermodesulfobacteriota bacterium]
MIPVQDIVPRRTFPVVTVGLILLNTVVFLFELLLPPDTLETLVFHLGIVPARYTDPSWAAEHSLPFLPYLAFFTAMFLHGGWVHLIGNMWTLWIFGDNVEDRMGHVRFLIFYLLCGIVASLVHIYVHPFSKTPVIGASGAISGVLGAYYGLFPWARIIVMVPIFFFPFFFEVPAIFYIGFWYFMQLMSGTLSVVHGQVVGGVAWWAHIGGFVFGLLSHRLFCWGRKGCWRAEGRPWGVQWSLGEKFNR